jgi:hypothetical protein
MNKNVKRVGIAVAGLALVGGFVASPAGASVRSTVITYPLVARSVAAKQVVDNSLPARKLLPADRAAFLKDTDAMGKAGVNKTCPAVVIAHMGGSFKAGKTKVCSFDLPKGTWLLNSNAFFARTAAGVAGTRPQLALRVGATDTAFGDDYGTILGAEISPAKDRELAASTVKVVTVTAPVTVDVFAFGYNDDTGTAGSGDITAAATIAAVLVG